MDWDKAYRDTYDDLFGYLYGRTSGNVELARDLVQDAFVRAMRHQDRFTYDDGNGLRRWLFTIARNLLFDHYRSHHTQRDVPVPVVLDDWTSAAVSAEEVVLPRMEAQQAMAALMSLNGQQREVMLLTCGEFPDAVIAHQVGRTVGAVKTMKCRARAELQRQRRRELRAVA